MRLFFNKIFFASLTQSTGVPEHSYASISSKTFTLFNLIGSDSVTACPFADYSMEANFDPATPWVKAIMEYVIEHGMVNTNLLNVNIPHPDFGPIKGMRVCRQSEGRWEEEFVEGEDPRGQKFYWLTGNFVTSDIGPDTDIHALRAGYISIVPSLHDLTSHQALPELKPIESLNLVL